MEHITNAKGKTLYLNSGDWIENLTALEYNKKKWKIYKHESDQIEAEEEDFEKENLLAMHFIEVLKTQ
jgi:hypothetical protein